ncbi:copper chaperone PCu(A)C [Shewanella intestini]|uniref:Copper chaperone PCu(A)C n=1 Tax=Shewanella intestini TaxID=2017544 RepID=A0ABS5I0W5_9GAMM|nr:MULTISPECIES: copper chaperone PCu(A)C [Shewanella]MBR9727662.1 copper chaperone PCu(A)C [Shewanella intestini]MRG35188.1 copper chaperone PCu(A)C [Shewanella sp. XMDDZSB0408]
MEFKTLKVIFKHLFNFFALMSFCSSSFASIVMTDGYVRAMPASVPNTAAYLTLENHYPVPVKLMAVKTEVAKEAQLHTIIEENGLVKMRQVSHFDIASHQQLRLQPSGDHIMLLGLKQPLNAGDKVKMTLVFSTDDTLDIELPVKKKMASNDEHAHHHHQH